MFSYFLKKSLEWLFTNEILIPELVIHKFNNFNRILNIS